MLPSPLRIVALLSTWLIGLPAGAAEPDPYEHYVRTSDDFRPVKQDKAWALKTFPSWTYMPWTVQWGVGYGDEAGRWSLAHGYNGAFVDRGNVAAEESKTGRIDWINKFGLRFYVDHAADKGLLHLWDGDKVKPHLAELHGTGVRPVPLNDATRAKLRDHLRKNIGAVKGSPHRRLCLGRRAVVGALRPPDHVARHRRRDGLPEMAGAGLRAERAEARRVGEL